MTRYIEIVSAPAQSLQSGLTARTYKPVQADEAESVFCYVDSASSRAGIAAVSAKLSNLRIGIVGLGGTGAYLLDFIAKTPVREIHLYDGDLFLQHNAFRAPSAASLEDLHAQPTKVDYLAKLYAQDAARGRAARGQHRCGQRRRALAVRLRLPVHGQRPGQATHHRHAPGRRAHVHRYGYRRGTAPGQAPAVGMCL